MSAVPAHLLAGRLQGAHLHQRPGRADEHGGAVAAALRIRTRRRRLAVSRMQGGFQTRGERLMIINL